MKIGGMKPAGFVPLFFAFLCGAETKGFGRLESPGSVHAVGRSRPAWGEDVEPLSYPRVAVSALSSCGVAPVDSAERLSDRRVVVVVLSSFVGRTGPWVDDPDGGMGNLRGHLYCAGVGRRCMRVDRTVTIGAFHDGRRLWRSGRRSGNGEGEELSVSEHCGAVVSSVSCVGGPGAVPVGRVERGIASVRGMVRSWMVRRETSRSACRKACGKSGGVTPRREGRRTLPAWIAAAIWRS